MLELNAKIYYVHWKQKTEMIQTVDKDLEING